MNETTEKDEPAGRAPVPPAGDGKTGKGAPREIGGPPGPEPTRYGDWEINGRVSDF